MLFDISPKEKQSPDLNFDVQRHSAGFISSQNDYLSKYLKEIETDHDVIHFTSNGRFALHDLIIFYAKKIGLCNVIVSSFNISVEASNKILKAWNQGSFSSFAMILNSQKKHNFIKSVRILENKIPMKFIPVHAKVAILWNDAHYITIVSSGNLSSNGNTERGFIFFDKHTFDFDYQWMHKIIYTTK
jgi:hypothetical protein